MSRLRTEHGFVGGAEALLFGVLVFVVGTLVILNAWSAVETRTAADAAARQAVRLLTESDPLDPGVLWNRTEQVVEATVNGYGQRAGDVVDIAITPRDLVLERCQRVTVRVTLRVPMVNVPLPGGNGSVGTRGVTGEHTEVVDPLRSGLPGRATCEF